VASRDRGVIQNRDVKIASGSSSVLVTAPSVAVVFPELRVHFKTDHSITP
jgi:hypothetical protein